MFSEPETIHFKKLIKSVFNTITFYLEYDNNEVDFKEKTMSSTIQLIKIWTNMFTYIYMSFYIYTSDKKCVYIQLYENLFE